MAIKEIKLTNFKTFGRLEVSLGKFNVLIGANASGKSNFIQIFKFLRDLAGQDLDDAISLQGGPKYLRNMSIGATEDLSVEVTADPETRFPIEKEKQKSFFGVKFFELNYAFCLHFRKIGSGFEVVRDAARVKFAVVRLEKEKRKREWNEREHLGDGEITINATRGKIRTEVSLPTGSPISEEDLVPKVFRQRPLPSRSLILRSPFFLFVPVGTIFRRIGIFDFDPKLPKKAVPITGRAELDEDGSNLALVLRSVLERRETKRKFSNFVRDLLPFVDDVDVERFADKSLLFKIRERYFKREYIPASLVSDGTIGIASIIVALYFERKATTIIEEPEKNIHPFLISKLVALMKDAADNTQVIVTTHNPEVVKYAGLGNILLVSRDESGFSTVSRPIEKEEVKKFLENEIGVDELYAQKLLEI